MYCFNDKTINSLVKNKQYCLDKLDTNICILQQLIYIYSSYKIIFTHCEKYRILGIAIIHIMFWNCFCKVVP